MPIRDPVIAFGTVAGSTAHARGGESAPPPDTRRIRLEDQLVLDQEATFYLQAEGDDAMEISGVRGGDWLVVDRAVKPRSGALVIASVGGVLALRRYEEDAAGRVTLRDEKHGRAKPLEAETDASVWGVVSWTIRRP